jgi:hypothetical protein
MYTDIRSLDVSNKKKKSIHFFHSAKGFKARESSKYLNISENVGNNLIKLLLASKTGSEMGTITGKRSDNSHATVPLRSALYIFQERVDSLEDA